MKKNVKFKDLPDTIGVTDYMAWRKVCRATADRVFHSKGFPRLKYTGNSLKADKRAVLIYETLGNLNIPEKNYNQIIIQIMKGELTNEEIAFNE